MDEMIKFDAPKQESSIIKVLGVGGGGSNAVNHMFNQGIQGVDFIVCNTDAQAIDKSPVPVKIQLGSGGLGAGSKPLVGRESAQESLEEIRAFLENDTKMLFVTAGMGGGTGTGAAPVIAELARELNILTVGIVTIPFQFEGKRRRIQAEEGIEELREHVDTLLTISNDKLREAYGNLRLSEAFAKADDILTVAARGIAEIITVSGLINVDFEDVKTVMKESGQAIMGSAVASGEDRAIKAISEALASPLLDDNNICGARDILLYIASAEDQEISMDEVSEITEYVQNESGNSADIIWGNGHDNSLGEAISVTLVATGFQNKENSFGEDSAEKKVNELYQSPKKENNKAVNVEVPVERSTPSFQQTAPPVQQQANPSVAPQQPQAAPAPPIPTYSPEPSVQAEKQRSSYEKTVYQLDSDIAPKSEVKEAPSYKEKTFFKFDENPSASNAGNQREISDSQRNENDNSFREDESADITRKRLKDISLKLVRDMENLETLEKQPAYMRRNVEINDSVPSKDQKVSRYTMSTDKEKNPEIRSNNPFLNDAVD
ncbi:MAG: cell division protein FtsZ [Bacteroidales bacterium]